MQNKLHGVLKNCTRRIHALSTNVKRVCPTLHAKALQTYRVWLLQPCLVARYVLETLAENGVALLSVQLSRKPKRLVAAKRRKR